MKLHLLTLLSVLCLPLPMLIASDHIDGPVTIGHPVADITDLYTFPSPDAPGHLTVIMNVYGGVAVDGHFSDKVTYNIVIRHAHIRGEGHEAGFETEGEYRVACNFETPHGLFSPHWITCKSSKGTTVREQVGQLNGKPSSDGLRVFSGRRSEPFFFNAKWATSAAKGGKLLPAKDDNIMHNLNVLSIVLLIDIEKELGVSEGPLFAVVGETTTKDGDAAAVRRVDRIGRPEITNVSMVSRDDVELRDLYNVEELFGASGKNFDRYRQRLLDNVAFHDKLDNTIEWTPESTKQVVEILVNDFQIVDVSKPYAADSYFEIEHSLLRGEPHSTCGGRRPNDDIMDVLFTLLINGRNSKLLPDGVEKPTRLATEVFPYLAEPNEGVAAELKGFAFRAAGRMTVPGRQYWIGVAQLASAVAALIGLVLLGYYVLRLGVARLKKREYPAVKRARVLAVIGLLFGIASLIWLITSAVSLPFIGVVAVICIVAFVRCVRWRKPIVA